MRTTDAQYGGWWVEICDCGWNSAPKHEQSIASKEGQKHQRAEHPDTTQSKKLTVSLPYTIVNWLEERYD